MSEQELKARLTAMQQKLDELHTAVVGDELRGIKGLVKRVAKLELGAIMLCLAVMTMLGTDSQLVTWLLMIFR